MLLPLGCSSCDLGRAVDEVVWKLVNSMEQLCFPILCVLLVKGGDLDF
jgi:hypothetical protein